MKVSIITPTADRDVFLQGLYSLLKNQSHTDWEWLIYDTSVCPQSFSDPRVNYYHSDAIITMGEKRKRLVQQATGDVIVQCDDDDYYAPNYLEFVIENLQKAAFFCLHSWFSYDLKTDQIFYRVIEEQQQTHYILNAISGSRVREIDLQGKKPTYNKRSMGYGFSFAYRKEVAERCAYPDCDLGEDRRFYASVEEKGFSVAMQPDQKGVAVHLIHEMNTSSDYPQYRIPPFLVENLFPDFFTHIVRYHEN